MRARRACGARSAGQPLQAPRAARSAGSGRACVRRAGHGLHRVSTAVCEARGRAGFGADKKRKGLLDWYFNSRAEAPKPREGALARSTPMRIEPKTFFANERTFLSWRAAAPV